MNYIPDTIDFILQAEAATLPLVLSISRWNLLRIVIDYKIRNWHSFLSTGEIIALNNEKEHQSSEETCEK